MQTLARSYFTTVKSEGAILLADLLQRIADAGAVADIESLVWRQYWDLYPRLEQDWAHFIEQVMEQKDETERQHACVRQRLQKLEQYITELEKQQPITLEKLKANRNHSKKIAIK